MAATSRDPADYLRFRDWMDSKEHLRNDWIVVCRFDKSSNDDFVTFSALIPSDAQKIEDLLGRPDWDAHFDLGHPFFSESIGEPSAIKFNLEMTEEVDDIAIEPFVLYRDFHGAFEYRVDIVQSFALYHNLYYDAEKDRYIDPLKEDVVVRNLKPRYVEVKTAYLKDYLAARNMALVRYHDFSRKMAGSATAILGQPRLELQIGEADKNYSIVVVDNPWQKGEIFSTLYGKDIVQPFNEPNHPNYKYLKGEQKFVNFLLRIDTKGDQVEETCNSDELSNNFIDRGKAHFLTPVFFRREVLQKYYQNPRRYTVQEGILFCLDLWSIRYDINKEGLVHVWLGDLGRIPYEEQLHWRQYNVLPSGGISENFYRTQILAEFVESEDPVTQLLTTYGEINKLFQSKFGFTLFIELSEQDSYIYKTLHIPITEEQKELDEQLVHLSKLLNDSIDKAELRTQVTWRPKTRYENKSIRFLEHFLIEKLNIAPALSAQVAGAFRNLQQLRSEAGAHPKTSLYQKILVNLGLDKADPSEIFRQVTLSLLRALHTIKNSLK